jgi:hypothetical protein
MIPIFLSDPAPSLLAAFVAAAVALALALSAPSALAGEVTLWVCHGPTGQPLGAGPLIPNSSGDGVYTSYGTGCDGQAARLVDGGLLAEFARPDPAAGSSADWRVSVPAGTTLDSVALDRMTSGFGGPPQPGDPLIYQVSTSTGGLESTSLGDGTDVPLSGSAEFPAASGEDVSFGVSCGATAAARCAASSVGPVSVKASSLALTVTDDAAPDVAVGGVSDPSAGVLPVSLTATDHGLGLESATATLAGEPPVTIDLGGPSCAPISSSTTAINLPLGADCPTYVTGVPLNLSTTGVADGPHSVTVTVTDVAGNTTTVVDETTVRNHLLVPGSSVLLAVGSGGQLPGTTGGTGGKGSSPAGTTLQLCVSPQLSVALASTPLRVSPGGRAVLWAGTRYLFTGRLTCVSKGRRVGAPTNTVVDIRSVVGRRKVPRTGVAVYAQGRFRVLLHPRSTRTIEFRVGVGAAVRQVSLHVIVRPHRGIA